MTIYNTPVTLYHNVMESNSFDRLINSKKGHTRKILKGNISYIWDRLTSQMIDEFGVSNEVKLIYYKQNTINRCEINMLLGGQDEATLIEILRSEINLIKSRIQEQSVKDIKKHHSRLYRILEERYKRDPKKLTVFEFYNDLNDLKDESEERKVKEMPRKKVANG